MRIRLAFVGLPVTVLVAVALFPVGATATVCTSPTITISPPTGPQAHVPLPNGYIGVPYEQNIIATGGTPPAGGYFWQDSTAANQIPPGIAQTNPTTATAHDTVL